MKAQVGPKVILLMVLALIAAALAIGAFTTHSGNAEDEFGKTNGSNSDRVDNASCERDCRISNPSGGSSYRSCLQGCS